MNYTYILKCADGTFYTGWTNSLEKRLKAHNGGKGCKYTRTRYPVELVYFESFEIKQEAQSREFVIKSMTRQEKQALIEGTCKSIYITGPR
jgi:putative endonuclease